VIGLKLRENFDCDMIICFDDNQRIKIIRIKYIEPIIWYFLINKINSIT